MMRTSRSASFDSEDSQMTPITPLSSIKSSSSTPKTPRLRSQSQSQSLNERLTDKELDECAISSDSDINSVTSNTTKLSKERRRKKSPSLTATATRQDHIASKIYRNLLILESSLIQQYESQQSLRRKYNLFLFILLAIGAFIINHLYFMSATTPASTPLLKNLLQLVLISELITLALFNLSGEYKRTIVQPRRFLSITNKGLRQINVKLVKVKIPISESLVEFLRTWLNFQIIFILKVLDHLSPPVSVTPVSSSFKSEKSKSRTMKEKDRLRGIKGVVRKIEVVTEPRICHRLKLVLNPRSFSTNLREGWELYRNEFWVREGLRRKQFNLNKLSGGSMANIPNSLTNASTVPNATASSASNISTKKEKEKMGDKKRKKRKSKNDERKKLMILEED